MNNVIKYQSPSATQTAVDTFDADNFYPFDGGIDGMPLDIEFSDADGNSEEKVKFKDKIKSGVQKRQQGNDSRIENKSQKLNSRLGRQSARAGGRIARKNARQIARSKKVLSNPKTAENVAKIEAKNPEVSVAVDATKNGQATPEQEKIAEQVFEAAIDMTTKGTSDAPDLGDNKNSDNWFRKNSKTLIGVGSLVGIGLIIFAVVKSTKK